MIVFTDHYVRPAPREAGKVLEREVFLGFRRVGLDHRLFYQLEGSFRRRVSVFPVKFIEASSEAEAKKHLRRIEDTVVIGRAKGPGALRVFSRDSRVDVVELTPRLTRLFDRNEAKLLMQGLSYVGINLSIIGKSPRMLPWIRSILARCFKHGIKPLVYTGASNPSSVWSPKSIYSLVRSLGFPRGFSLSVLTSDLAMEAIGR